MTPEYTIGQATVQLSRARPVRGQSMRIEAAIRPHDHVFYEICYIQSGSVRHQTGASETILHAGDLVIIPVGGVHAFSHPRNCQVINLYYLADWLLTDLRDWWQESALLRHFFSAHLFKAQSYRQPTVLRLPEKIGEQLGTSFEQLLKEDERENPSVVYLRTTLIKLMLEISREIADGAPHKTISARQPEIQQVLLAVEECLATPRASFSPAALARHVGMVPDRLTRAFRAEFGLALRDYFQRRRIQIAAHALLDPRRPIAAIAYDLGFCDAPHFHRMFTRIIGQSPKNDRQAMTTSSGSTHS